jgi:hypothetical protein
VWTVGRHLAKLAYLVILSGAGWIPSDLDGVSEESIAIQSGDGVGFNFSDRADLGSLGSLGGGIKKSHDLF